MNLGLWDRGQTRSVHWQYSKDVVNGEGSLFDNFCWALSEYDEPAYTEGSILRHVWYDSCCKTRYLCNVRVRISSSTSKSRRKINSTSHNLSLKLLRPSIKMTDAENWPTVLCWTHKHFLVFYRCRASPICSSWEVFTRVNLAAGPEMRSTGPGSRCLHWSRSSPSCQSLCSFLRP